MMNLTEYQKKPAQLADYIPWAALVAEGVVLNKDGSFQRTAGFRGPDLESSTENELVVTTSRLNNALKRLGSGWALFVEAERRPAGSYPISEFPEALSWLVDQERRATFEEVGAHFESAFYLTLLYLPPPESRARAKNWLFEPPSEDQSDWREVLASFITETDRFFALLESLMPELAWLSDTQTLTYLHATVSTHRHPISVPEIPCYLDALLCDDPLTGGLALALGDCPLQCVSVRGFPSSTWPGTLDELNRLGFSYRWMTRFICLDKADAERELTKRRRQWFAKRKGIVTLLREMIFQQESPLVDSDAANKAADADAALQELGNDTIANGYITSTVVVMAPNVEEAHENRKSVERVIQGRGFVTIAEKLNAVEAWLSSLPGHAYANVRHPLVSTLNLAHLMPLSAVWAGPSRNDHLDGPPLIVTRTEGATPFRLVTHVGDVGHTLIVGPTGAGKSVLTNTLMLQFRRYPQARIFVFDKGRSARATALGLAGEYYDLGTDSDLAFQPLARIDTDAERAWAADWIASLFSHEKIEVTPDVKETLWSALGSLASAPIHERTLTGLSVLLQSNLLRQALQPYTLNGSHGRLLDADVDRLKMADIQCFETEDLLHARSAGLPVLTYLFHRLEDRFDGCPTLLILAEAWAYLDDPLFAGRLREWLKTLRKRNVSVVMDTQALADIQRSSIASALIESCPTRIYLPSPQATEPQMRVVYESFGLNDRQISLIAHATPKRDYYYQSPLGQRMFELGMGPIGLAFAGASRPEDQRAMDALLKQGAGTHFLPGWLHYKGMPWAAELSKQYPSTGATRR
jgi:type IV secretion system protein VirB4